MIRKKSAGTHEIQHEAGTLSFALMYSKRRTLTIRVHPNQEITVDAPVGTSMAWIREIVQKKAGWIVRKQREIETRTPSIIPQRQYISGETYRYLGRQIHLKVEAGMVKRADFAGEILTITTPTPDNSEQVAGMIHAWFERQARAVFAERMAVCLLKSEALGIPAPQKLTIRLMKTRWGSCSGRGRVTLNRRLIQVNIESIDYVILHELAHLRELNHSSRFYALLAKLLPDWAEKRRTLNQCEVMW